MKFFIKIHGLIFLTIAIAPLLYGGGSSSATSSSSVSTVGYGSGCSKYQDEFGGFKTGYTMGDLVRYTVYRDSSNPNGLNMYYGLVTPPVGASDIFNFGQNTHDLYNALGYLYAGFCAPQNTVSNLAYRLPKGGSLDAFDNNQTCQNTIWLPTLKSLGTPYVAGFSPHSGDTSQSFNNVKIIRFGVGDYLNPVDASFGNANASCGWCPNVDDGSYVLACQPKGMSFSFVAPTGQFFGARLAHILGAVVNDVPWSTNTSSNASGGTYRYALMSGADGKGTALPMVAVMKHNGEGWTFTPANSASNPPTVATSTAPAGMFCPSTAHYGSMLTFLGYLEAGFPTESAYLNYHLKPTLTRLSGLCSYQMSTNTRTLNYLKIKDTQVTSYDNGVVVSIQNNSGDVLQINQVTSSGPYPIATLNAGDNSYYLHTASLMTGSTSANGVTSPDPSQAISIIDTSVNQTTPIPVVAGTYVQVLSSVQLQGLCTALNALYNHWFGSGAELNYNQAELTYVVPVDATPAYVVVTSFDPTLNSGQLNVAANWPSNSSGQESAGYKVLLSSYRIQAINVAEFGQKPYFLTLQINKEKLGYGLQADTTTDASGSTATTGYSLSKVEKRDDVYILQPSVNFADVYTYINKTAHIEDTFNRMPVLMIPDQIMNQTLLGAENYGGLRAYYIIWLMAYCAAMTEFASNSGVGKMDIPALRNMAMNLASSKTECRVVVDQQGHLKSGQIINVDANLSLCGCDTWDFSFGWNQDIPILNLYVDGQGNVVVNKTGNVVLDKTVPVYINYQMQVAGSEEILFSLPQEAVEQGVLLQVQQVAENIYQLIITATSDFTDSYREHIFKGSTIVAPKFFVATSTIDPTNVSCSIKMLGGTASDQVFEISLGKETLMMYKNEEFSFPSQGQALSFQESLLDLSLGSYVGGDGRSSFVFAGNSTYAMNALVANGKASNAVGTALFDLLTKEKEATLDIVVNPLASNNGILTKVQVLNSKAQVVGQQQFTNVGTMGAGMPSEMKCLLTLNSSVGAGQSKLFDLVNGNVSIKIVQAGVANKKATSKVANKKTPRKKVSKKSSTVKNKKNKPKPLQKKQVATNK